MIQTANNIKNKDYPFVSIIIPCRNEKKYINQLLESINNQDYPKDRFEVIIADGMSDDGTRDILSEISSNYEFLKVIDNEKKIVSTALNKAINISKGEYIIRLDAHSTYPKNYFSRLIEVIENTGADNVGGMCITKPGNDSLTAKSISIIMSCHFGVGNSAFRTPTTKTEPFEVDTVPFGCYRRSVFDKIGYFDEELIRNQDNEFNERLLLSGGKILLIPDLKIEYFSRENYNKLWKMNYHYALLGPLVDKKLGKIPRIRKYIPSLFVLSLLIPLLLSIKIKKAIYISYFSLLSYFICNLYFSFKECKKKKNFILFPYLICAFCVAHFSYGIGFINGIIRLLTDNKAKISDLSR